jgi:predicted nuclease with TOPRIM domain
MTKADKEEVRQMLTDIIAVQVESINGKFELIKQELGAIKEQTTKHNGRMSKIEDKIKDLEINEVKHLVSCPQAAKIIKIDEAIADYKITKGFIGKIIAVTVGLSSAIISIINIVFF